jgi:hypothetical protein
VPEYLGHFLDLDAVDESYLSVTLPNGCMVVPAGLQNFLEKLYLVKETSHNKITDKIETVL